MRRPGPRRRILSGRILSGRILSGGQVLNRGQLLSGGRAQPGGGRCADEFVRAQDEALDPPVGGDRLGQRLRRVLHRRPVVRLAQVVAQLHRPHLGHHHVHQQRVAQRLAHLLAGHPEQAVVHPVVGELVTGRPGLGEFVLVVGEHQVQAAAMDVERGAQVLGGHSGAFQVPARAARPPRRLPERLAGLRALPQGEVAGIPFGIVGVGVVGGPHVIQALPGQRAVRRPGADVEVDVTAGGVRVAAADQPPHECDHLRHVAGRPRLHVRRQAAEHVVGAGERPLVALGDRPPGELLRGGDPQDLVVDVGDVPAERDLVAAGLQPADEDVEVDAGPDVPDVRRRLHGGTAQVYRHRPGADRGELTHRARGCVMEAERHPVRLPGTAAHPPVHDRDTPPRAMPGTRPSRGRTS